MPPDSADPADTTRPAAVEAWLEGLIGGKAKGWRRLVSGNSRATWSMDVDRGADTVPLVVRIDEGNGPLSGTPLTLGREAEAYAAVQDTGIRIPRFFGYHGELQALATERVDGTPEWDDDVLAQVLSEAARLHLLDVDDFELPGFSRRSRGEVELWAGIAATRIASASPLIDFAVAFLLERFPGEPERPVFVHGDLGIGNTLWSDGKISALLDWELAHLGDPHDELAFMTVRAALYELDMPRFGELVRDRYEAPAGITLEPSRLHYWQAVGLLRNLVICHASIAQPISGRDRFVHFMLIPSLNRLLTRALAKLAAVTLPVAEEEMPEPEVLPGARLMSEFARELADLPDAVPDEARRQRVRRMRFLLAQFAETWGLAPEIARRDAAESPADDPRERIVQLAVAADRELALFPRAVPMANRALAQLAETVPKPA
jgi:aminoglycoside phosphotransferase (APT) family kinase protein